MFKSKLSGFVAGLALVGGLAFAANTFYAGYTPNTNQRGENGVPVAGGAVPVITGTAGCGTLTAQVGGTGTGSVTIGTFSSSCALTVTLPVPTIVVSSGNNDGKNAVNSAAAPNGIYCTFLDKTTPTDSVYAASSTTTACVTNTATMVTGDVIQFNIQAY